MDHGSASVEVETREQGSVARITVSHPGKLNAVSRAMMAALQDILQGLRSREDLRAVVVEGEGSQAFIGGAYVPDLYGLDSESCRAYIRELHDVNVALRSFPAPVIAVIRGYCIGAGVELSSGCDFRLADSTAKIGMPEVNVGMPSVIDAECLPRLIGWGNAREMVLTGGVYDAKAAHNMGFFQSVVAPGQLEELLQEKLRQILGAAPRAVRAQKKLLNAWEDLHHASGLEIGIDMLSEAYATGEPHDRLAGFMKKNDK